MKTLFLILFALTMFVYAQSTDVAVNNTIPDSHNISSDEQDPPDDMAVDKMPTPIQTQYPAYPFTARQEGLNGTVYLKLLVGEDGTVKKSKVIQSAFTQKDIALDLAKASSTVKLAVDSITLACVKAVSQWKFSPAVKNEKPVKVWVVLPFKFKLDSPHKEEKKEKK